MATRVGGRKKALEFINVTNFSLRHRIKLPGGTDSSLARGMHKSPLLILCHEIGGHEDQLMELANQFDNRFTIISVRAPFEQTPPVLPGSVFHHLWMIQ
jgi:hypothetical protein